MRRAQSYHRVDRDATRRRARAQAHLDRVRRRRVGVQSLRIPKPRVVTAVLAALLGAVGGEALFAAGAGSEPRLVEVIAVRGGERLSAAQVAEATGVAPGAPLLELDTRAVSEQLERHDWIAEAAALQLPGGALLVSVVERRPLATVSVDGRLYAVDERGAPFAPLDAQADPGLLRLVAKAEVAPREPSAALAQALRLAARLPELGMAPPAEVSIASEGDPEGYALRLSALPARVLLGRADLDARLEDLARLLAARPDAVAEATSIDLRFANQVVLRSAPTRDGSANTAEGRGGAPPRNRRPTG